MPCHISNFCLFCKNHNAQVARCISVRIRYQIIPLLRNHTFPTQTKLSNVNYLVNEEKVQIYLDINIHLFIQKLSLEDVRASGSVSSGRRGYYR